MQGGNYGAQRMYGAIGWGTMSLVAGVVIQHYGIYAGFACYTAVAVFAIVPLFLLPMDALHSKLAQSQLTARPTAAIAIAGQRMPSRNQHCVCPFSVGCWQRILRQSSTFRCLRRSTLQRMLAVRKHEQLQLTLPVQLALRSSSTVARELIIESVPVASS